MKAALQNYWSSIRAIDSHAWWLEPEQSVLAIADQIPSGKVLDMGCGMGRHTVALAQKGFEVIAFDGAIEAVAYTQTWLKELHLKAEVSASDFLEWNYEENTYDLILSINSFHHAKEQEVRMLAEKITKALKLGGFFVANVPALRPKKVSEEYIEKQTVVSLEGAEKGVPHFLFTQEQIFEFFPNFEIQIHIVRLGNNTEDHFDICAKKIA